MFERDMLNSPLNLDINGLSSGESFPKKRELIQSQQIKIRRNKGMFTKNRAST